MQPVVERIHPSRPLEAAIPKKPRSRAQRIAIGAAGAAAIGLLTYAVLAYVHQTAKPVPLVASAVPQPTTQIVVTPTPAPTSFASLNGRPVVTGKESLRPLAVMIENHPDARPQAGLGQANVVYEAIAEGGITRFMALFDNPAEAAARVGPIRSARTYYLHIAEEYRAIYAHAGGNIDALDELSAGTSVANLDGLAIGAPVFTRDYSRNVASEHTLYSTTDKLWNYAVATQKASTAATYAAWTFQDDAPLDSRPASQAVDVNVSTSEYNVTWNYDRASNSYLRVMAGTPHIDATTRAQITAKNVVLQTVDRREIRTRINEDGWVYTTTGSGPATVIQNGTAIHGTWKNDGTRTRYYDSSGAEIKLVRGTTWVHLTHSDSRISFR